MRKEKNRVCKCQKRKKKRLTFPGFITFTSSSEQITHCQPTSFSIVLFCNKKWIILNVSHWKINQMQKQVKQSSFLPTPKAAGFKWLQVQQKAYIDNLISECCHICPWASAWVAKRWIGYWLVQILLTNRIKQVLKLLIHASMYEHPTLCQMEAPSSKYLDREIH